MSNINRVTADAAVQEVMGLVAILRQEALKATEVGVYLKNVQTTQDAIESKLRALLAGAARVNKHHPVEPLYTAPQQADARDAARYRFIVEHKLILSGGTEQFGWPIAPFGNECSRYIDAAMSAQAANGGDKQ